MRLVYLAVLASAAFAQDAADIVRRSLDRDANNIERLRNYTFIERAEERFLDKNGKVTKTETNAVEIVMLGGRPYGKKIAHNDKPLSADETRKEEEKLEKAAARRKLDLPKDAARRAKAQAEERRFLREIPEAFNLRVTGTEIISGKPTWVIEATPKPGYRPKMTPAKVFPKVRGKLWIDQSEYQWVRAEANVLDTISFGFGLLRVSQGSTLHFTQMRINDEVWVPQLVAVRADGRLGYLKKLRFDLQVDYRDYKKFQSDSRLLETEAVEAPK